MTLRARIYLLIALAVMPAFALLAYDHARTLQREAAAAEQQALQSTLLVSAELDQIFKGFFTLLRAAGETPVVNSLENPGCTSFLARLENINSNAGWIVATDWRGRIICGRPGKTGTVADRDYFALAIETNEPTIGTYSVGRASDKAVIPLALRFQTSDGPGVLVIGVRLDWLRDLFAARFAELPADSSLTIVDRNGIILVRLPNSDRAGERLDNYQYVVTAPEPGVFRSIAERNADGIARFLGYSPLDSLPRGVAIAVGFPQEAVLAGVRNAAIRNYLLLGLVTVFAAAAAVLVGRASIRQPMNQLLETVETWRKQDLSARVKHGSGRSEFDQLGQAFNSMADDLEAALKHKDILLRELSHRVMNNLQTISAMFRMEAKSAESPSDAARFEQAISRLEAIALVYRRMQTMDFAEAIEVSGFLTEICANLGLSMDTPCVVKADEKLLPPNQAVSLALIVNELVTNAIKYGANHSAPVAVEFRVTADQCRLSVQNRGSMPADAQSKSKGFGMRMITSMVSQLQGDLEIISKDGRTEIQIAFPNILEVAADAAASEEDRASTS